MKMFPNEFEIHGNENKDNNSDDGGGNENEDDHNDLFHQAPVSNNMQKCNISRN